MELPLNQFKRGMKAGKAQIGLWSSLSSHYSVEVIAGSGFDWLLLDTEHSPNDLENVVTQLQAASAYPTTAIVRPAWNDMVLIKRFLDVGVQTLLIPYVQTAEEAAAAVSYMRYPVFLAYDIVGGILWGAGVTLLGYFLGNVPFVKNNLELMILLIVFLSILPGLAAVARNMMQKRKIGPGDR